MKVDNHVFMLSEGYILELYSLLANQSIPCIGALTDDGSDTLVLSDPSSGHKNWQSCLRSEKSLRHWAKQITDSLRAWMAVGCGIGILCRRNTCNGATDVIGISSEHICMVFKWCHAVLGVYLPCWDQEMHVFRGAGTRHHIVKWGLWYHRILQCLNYLSYHEGTYTLAENENNIWFCLTTANLSYGQKCWHFSDHSKLHSDLQLWSLVY